MIKSILIRTQVDQDRIFNPSESEVGMIRVKNAIQINPSSDFFSNEIKNKTTRNSSDSLGLNPNAKLSPEFTVN